MWRAWVGVRRNDGAGSIDRIAPDAVEEYGVTRILDALVTDLREDRWHPMPFRRVFIPKFGSAERRPLSIRGA
jgi:RNA-directed DNA polymerase